MILRYLLLKAVFLFKLLLIFHLIQSVSFQLPIIFCCLSLLFLCLSCRLIQSVYQEIPIFVPLVQFSSIFLPSVLFGSPWLHILSRSINIIIVIIGLIRIFLVFFFFLLLLAFFFPVIHLLVCCCFFFSYLRVFTKIDDGRFVCIYLPLKTRKKENVVFIFPFYFFVVSLSFCFWVLHF